MGDLPFPTILALPVAFGLFGAAVILGLLRPVGRFGLAGALTLGGCVVTLAIALFSPTGFCRLSPLVGLSGVPIEARVDSLSRWFLFLIGLIGVVVCIYLPGYLSHMTGRAKPGSIWSGLALLFASMAGVVLASNAVVFIASWELMAVSSFALVATDHERQSVHRAAFVYFGATRIGSGFLMAGFLWAHSLTGSWDFGHWFSLSATASGPAILILLGLLTKAGSWPFHLWLPIAHPAAPCPVSAVMSGVMIKIAIYGIFRLFLLDGQQASWVGWGLVIAGAISAFWGVLFALLQHDLKRLLAYHSVENIGLILLAAGASLLARTVGMVVVAEGFLAAGLFHTLNHGIFKTLLFLGAGAVEAGTHTRDIDRLGGLIHRMPWTAGAFFVGSAAICALPPLNGFASEWILFKGLFQVAVQAPTGEIRLAGLLLIGWVGLVGALALACFAKAFGIAFLGRPRSKDATNAKEGNAGMVVASVLLALLCIGLGLGVQWVLAAMAQMGFVHDPRAWSLPILPLAGVGFTLLFLIWVATRQLGKKRPERTYVTWDCGFCPLSPRTQYTATSFAQPIVRIFGALYRYEIEISLEGKRPRSFPTEVRAEARHEAYLESRVYSPALRAVVRFSEGFIMRLQAGSIHQYLLFMVVTLGLLLWLGGVR
jgi:hydrogenase-4 component B